MYRTNFGIGHSMKEILEAHRPPGGRLGKANPNCMCNEFVIVSYRPI